MEIYKWFSEYTVKPVLSGHSKIDKTKICMTNGSLMKVDSIAECSPWSILQYFWPALRNNWSWKPIFCLFESGRFTQVLHVKIACVSTSYGSTYSQLQPVYLAFLQCGQTCTLSVIGIWEIQSWECERKSIFCPWQFFLNTRGILADLWWIPNWSLCTDSQY